MVLAPMTKMVSAPSISLMELVIAPEPKVVTRPATVGLCQSLAQWSTVFVSITVRVNYRIR